MKITNLKNKENVEINVGTYEGPEDESELRSMFKNVRFNKINAIVNQRCMRPNWSFVIPKTNTEKPVLYRLMKDVEKVYRLEPIPEGETIVYDLISVDFKGNKKNYTFKVTKDNYSDGIDFADLIQVLEEGCGATLALTTGTEGWNVSGTTLSFTSGETLAQTGVITVTATLDETEKSSSMKVKIDDTLYAELKGEDSGSDPEPTVLGVTITKLPSANAPKDANEEICKVNQDAVTVTQSGSTVTVTGNLDALQTSTSSNPSQGDGKWVALIVNTTYNANNADVYYNGSILPQSEYTEAQDLGIDGTSDIILWIKAEVVAETPKVITLKATEKGTDTIIGAENTITINFVNA